MNWLDAIIGAISPQAGVRRLVARRAFDGMRGLDGGRDNRLTARWNNRPDSGELANIKEVRNARERAWDLYRNNPYARLIVRTLIAQVVGCGFNAESQAVKPRTGEADTRFRKKAKSLWVDWAQKNHFYLKLIQILKECALSGEVLIRRRFRETPGNIVPYDIEVIACERLVEDSILPSTFRKASDDNIIYKGIEFDKSGKRIAYHIDEWHPQDPRPVLKVQNVQRIPADEIIHLFVQERPDQVRGYSWFAPAILLLKAIGDYEDAESTAAYIGACVVAGVTRLPGNGTTSFGLNAPTGGDTVDTDGNPIQRMQPGMWIDNLRPGEKIEGFNPQRPNSMAEAFVQHLLRCLAGSLPGIKSSTITKDYRQSSFSSERSADNDAWRETEQVQEWLCDMVCQPIYEDVLQSGVDSGEMDGGIDGRAFDRSAFEKNFRYYSKCSWAGPVAKSINPRDDEEASKLAIEIGTSSLPVEAAARGLNWEELMEDQAKVSEKRKELGIPDPAQLEADVLKAQANPQPAEKPSRFLNA